MLFITITLVANDVVQITLSGHRNCDHPNIDAELFSGTKTVLEIAPARPIMELIFTYIGLEHVATNRKPTSCQTEPHSPRLRGRLQPVPRYTKCHPFQNPILGGQPRSRTT